jgi:hypothetical protein
LSREESAVSLLSASRFLADNAGFGMTRKVFLRKLHYDQPLTQELFGRGAETQTPAPISGAEGRDV